MQIISFAIVGNVFSNWAFSSHTHVYFLDSKAVIVDRNQQWHLQSLDIMSYWRNRWLCPLKTAKKLCQHVKMQEQNQRDIGIIHSHT